MSLFFSFFFIWGGNFKIKKWKSNCAAAKWLPLLNQQLLLRSQEDQQSCCAWSTVPGIVLGFKLLQSSAFFCVRDISQTAFKRKWWHSSSRKQMIHLTSVPHIPRFTTNGSVSEKRWVLGERTTSEMRKTAAEDLSLGSQGSQGNLLHCPLSFEIVKNICSY